ncbi:zinc dependent phospholipase C family protein [Flammeovirga sp. OC4]|uniref:zinc dependent phospholipase C family protein n=1 Tax=Flammeovirga sp. OC4 TaxID=1382345 RepID=UPI0006936867|nr:zinc dependent phospholipase C family protein [Flammeovirga sp. OC4]
MSKLVENKDLTTMLLQTISILFWGFYAHVTINTEAVLILPQELFPFYKSQLSEIKKGAVRPDQRRGLLEREGGKHYIDIEHYSDSILLKTMTYDEALLIYGEKHLIENGEAPWNLIRYYYMLRKAFEDRNEKLIIKYSSEVGHYLADLHVPLHTTENYNGQLTGQIGIHSFWESTLPEHFGNYYSFSGLEPYYIEDIKETVWQIMRESHALVDKVLKDERVIVKQLPSSSGMTIKRRGRRLEIQASEEYAKAYHDQLGGMVENRMQLAVQRIASFWYTCWIDAGQPELNKTKNTIE